MGVCWQISVNGVQALYSSQLNMCWRQYQLVIAQRIDGSTFCYLYLVLYKIPLNICFWLKSEKNYHWCNEPDDNQLHDNYDQSILILINFTQRQLHLVCLHWCRTNQRNLDSEPYCITCHSYPIDKMVILTIKPPALAADFIIFISQIHARPVSIAFFFFTSNHDEKNF